MINLIAADGQFIVLNGLNALLNNSEINLTQMVSTSTELQHQLALGLPDLVLLDINTISTEGLELLATLREQYTTLKLLIFTTYIEQSIIKKALKIGVEGYILKDISKEELINAITTIIRGDQYFDKRITEVLMDSYQTSSMYYRPDLTNREKEITVLIANGMSTQEIANILFVSPLTIETHRKNIFSKLGINKMTALVRYAVQKGLVN